MKIAIAFATLSGNTEIFSLELQKFLLSKSYNVDLINLDGTNADDLKKYDFVFLGSSTYGDGELNLIMDIFFSDAENAKHNCCHTKFAVFSLGDSIYPNFAEAGQIIEDKITDMGGIIIHPHIKIDGYASTKNIDEIEKWALEVLKKI
jgi:flavodoxin I